MSAFCLIDDKHVPLYRIMWISHLPHFCGSEDCLHEGQYEIRLEQGESIWATQSERDAALVALEVWQGGEEPADDDFAP